MELDPGYSHVRVGVKAIIVSGTSVLFNEGRRRNDGGLVYDLPGGGQEHGEGQIEALMRECEEEIGVRPRVFDLAFTFDLRSTEVGRLSDEGEHLFHQQNLAFWCDLPHGVTPHMGAGKDARQVGLRWLEISELHTYPVWPREVAAWLQDDPSTRPRTLGTLG